MLPADGYIRRSQTLDVPIQREHFPLKSDEPNIEKLLDNHAWCNLIWGGVYVYQTP